MPGHQDRCDLRLLDGWQRGFPLVLRPFAVIGARLGLSEAETLARLTRLAEAGAISRIGATLRPNVAGASTLAAIASPPERVEADGLAIAAEPGVNHCYLREHDFSLWFVATGPDRAAVDATLVRVRAATGRPVLDLPLLQPFALDLGFPLGFPLGLPLGGPERGGTAAGRPCRAADASALRPGDRAILQALTDGLALVSRPFAAIAAALGRAEAEIIGRVEALVAAGVIARLGVIVRHRALGWTSNAMIVWDLAPAAARRAGPRLAATPGVTLAYERRPAPPDWPYRLFAMIHARSRAEAMETLGRAEAAAGLSGVPHAVLFSLRCFKQRGALVDPAHRASEAA